MVASGLTPSLNKRVSGSGFQPSSKSPSATSLQQPESEKLEFKKRLPDFRKIVSNLVAFANTNGGKLIIGVDDRGKIVGINNSERARRIISKAADAISPPLKVHIQPIEVEGKKVLVVDIPTYFPQFQIC